MPIIKNKLNQPFALFLRTGNSIQLLAKGTAEISEKELALPEIQRLLARRDMAVVEKKAVKAAKKEDKK